MPTPKSYYGTTDERLVLDINSYTRQLKSTAWKVLYKTLKGRPTRKEIAEKLKTLIYSRNVITESPSGEERTHYYLNFTYVGCRLGGVRYYLICPFCNKRCTKLYCCGDFACRECAKLTYERDRKRHGRFEYMSRTTTLLKDYGLRADKLRYPCWKGRMTKRAWALLKKKHKLNLYTAEWSNLKTFRG